MATLRALGRPDVDRGRIIYLYLFRSVFFRSVAGVVMVMVVVVVVVVVVAHEVRRLVYI